MQLLIEPRAGVRVASGGAGGTSNARRPAGVVCRLMALAWVAGALAWNLFFLSYPSPIDLAEDEAYYWDWSRHLDLSYYSKGPLVAYLIRASCALVGETALGVRLPALVLAAGTALLTYWLTLRLFRSEKLALGATVLSYLTPIAVSRGLVMTIDPPLYFCWALATGTAHLAAAGRKGWAWPIVGAAVGLGMMAKFSMGLWAVGLAAWLALDPVARRGAKVRHLVMMVLAAALFMTPMIVWNARHAWVTLHHVGENIGASTRGAFSGWFVLDFWAGQFGVMGPGLLALMGVAVGKALRRREGWREGWRDEWPYARGRGAAEGSPEDAVRFLLCFGLTFFLLVLAASFRSNPGANWALPAYFTLNILLAFVVSQYKQRLAWRWGLGAAVGVNVVLVGLAYGSELLYRPYASLAPRWGLPREAMKVDPTARVRGWEELGAAVSAELRRLGEGAFVLADRYTYAAELAFYVEGQPAVHCAGSYFKDPKSARGMSQYDLWPDRALDRRALRGKDAVYFGQMNDEVRGAFASVEALPEVVIERRGLRVRSFTIWRCRGFKGMCRPTEGVRYWSRN